ncbi:hypothetical protein SKAU_G00016180 [Synaphobranchus kaupii]|uniref:ribonuclease H n=1 Tax=Synaphobranchus kaupii TaxID=118154 RepID=A0A9Q1GAW8_SYNKA|nr:hypothetical protein SKAU_G00016180 [Synaphobranchus kaupii]
MVTEVTEGLDGVFCHIDDVLVCGRSQEQHNMRLHEVLGKIENAGITLNIEKCALSQREDEVWRPVDYASRSLTLVEQRYAQVEKEALGLTWACERFRDFLIGGHFEIETDHKPLLSLLGAQALDALPPRIQRFRMRLMRYSCQISHVPGKSLWTADTLSRAPLRNNAASADDELMESTNIYVDSVMEQLPASASYLDSLREHLKADSVCSSVMRMCQDRWPEFSCCNRHEKLYWGECAFLTVPDRLLLKGTRLLRVKKRHSLQAV